MMTDTVMFVLARGIRARMGEQRVRVTCEHVSRADCEAAGQAEEAGDAI